MPVFGRSADVTIQLFRPKYTRKSEKKIAKNMGSYKSLFPGFIVRYPGLAKSYLSNVPCARLVNVWPKESRKSVSFLNSLRRRRQM